MRRINGFILSIILVIVLLGSGITTVDQASVQPIPTPSIPQFTIYLVNHPYEVPETLPTYTTDPYNGEQKLTSPGSPSYQANNVTIELWILNGQPSYSKGTVVYTPYYDVRTKGHFEENWTELYSPVSRSFGVYVITVSTPVQSSFTYTVITYSSTFPPCSSSGSPYSPNATIDFQVSTMLGYPTTVPTGGYLPVSPTYEEALTALHAQSAWSETQLITISNSSILASTLENPAKPIATPIPLPTDMPPPPIPTPTSVPTPTPTVRPSDEPTQISLSLDSKVLAASAVAVMALIIATLAFIYRGHRKPQDPTQTQSSLQ